MMPKVLEERPHFAAAGLRAVARGIALLREHTSQRMPPGAWPCNDLGAFECTLSLAWSSSAAFLTSKAEFRCVPGASPRPSPPWNYRLLCTEKALPRWYGLSHSLRSIWHVVKVHLSKIINSHGNK